MESTAMHNIYDKIFKKILTLSSGSVIRLINGLFETDYPTDSTVTYNWTEFHDDRLRRTLADTILTMAVWLRITETKPLCRAVKELRRDYDRVRAPHIDKAHEDSEIENGYIFEECVKDITNQLLVNLRIDLRSEYPEIEPDDLDFLIAVYQCDITLKALLFYIRKQTDKIAKKIGRSIGNILPEAVYKLNKLILEFVGDKPVSERFAILKKQYIETFATQIAIVNLNELCDNNQPQIN